MTYCLTDSAGKEYFVQAERREDAERFAYVRGLCFTGRTAPHRTKRPYPTKNLIYRR